MFKIIISPKAIKQLRLLKFIHKEAVELAIDDLKNDPEAGKKLKDNLLGKYSYRIGVYRIIYGSIQEKREHKFTNELGAGMSSGRRHKIDESNQTVYIMSAGHRSVVYG